MLTFAVAAEVRLIVVRGGAASRVVFFCAVSAGLCLSARHCNVAIGLALVALGHGALTVKKFAVSWLVVMYKPIRNQGVCFFGCSQIN
jgi:hypothetical protein